MFFNIIIYILSINLCLFSSENIYFTYEKNKEFILRLDSYNEKEFNSENEVYLYRHKNFDVFYYLFVNNNDNYANKINYIVYFGLDYSNSGILEEIYFKRAHLSYKIASNEYSNTSYYLNNLNDLARIFLVPFDNTSSEVKKIIFNDLLIYIEKSIVYNLDKLDIKSIIRFKMFLENIHFINEVSFSVYDLKTAYLDKTNILIKQKVIKQLESFIPKHNEYNTRQIDLFYLEQKNSTYTLLKNIPDYIVFSFEEISLIDRIIKHLELTPYEKAQILNSLWYKQSNLKIAISHNNFYELNDKQLQFKLLRINSEAEFIDFITKLIKANRLSDFLFKSCESKYTSIKNNLANKEQEQQFSEKVKTLLETYDKSFKNKFIPNPKKIQIRKSK